MRIQNIAVYGLLMLVLQACDGNSANSEGPRYASAPAAGEIAVYRMAIHPLHNPHKLSQSYEPLVTYLDKKIPQVHFELEASRDYRIYEEKYRTREPEFLLPNPWQTLDAMQAGYEVIAMAGDAEDFRGIFLVRKDSTLKHPQQLKGKTVSYPAPTALAACIMPQYFLHRQGLNVMRDVQSRYVGSQESSITHVLLQQVDAGATWPPPWRAYQKDHPKEAAQLKVIWETPHLLNNSVMVRDTVPPLIRHQVRELLLDLHKSEEGRRILAGMQTARFHAAGNASYEPVRQFIRTFEREVRTVKGE